MRKINRSVFFPLAIVTGLLLCGAGSFAQNKLGLESIHSLVKAETDFQQVTKDKGQRQAYLSVMRPNAILFKPGPVNGVNYTVNKKEYKGGMFWAPAWAEVSKDGYFGYTTGPYSYLLNDTTYSGEYVSVWIREKYQPEWKLLLDAGISHGKPTRPASILSFPVINVTKDQPVYPKVIAASKDILFSTDELFATFLNTRSVESSYAEYLDKGSRLFVQGHLPVSGKDSILSYFRNKKGAIRTRTDAAYVCYGRDMGFTYGKGEFVDAFRKKPADFSFNYLRIWRKGADGIWRIILEMQMAA